MNGKDLKNIKKNNHKILNKKKVLLSIANCEFNKFLSFSISLPLDFSVNIVTFFEIKRNQIYLKYQRTNKTNSLDPIFSYCIYSISSSSST